MEALLIISTLGILLLGYVIVRRIDSFIEKGGIIDGPLGRANQGVLVFGAPEVVQKIQKSGVKCKLLSEYVFPEDGFYSAIFILSGDDAKNLAICNIAKRADPGIYIVARCNSEELRNVFEIAGANRLLKAGEPVELILTELWGVGG